MKQVVVVKLAPDAGVHGVVAETLRVCNAEANRIAQVAFAHRDRVTGHVEREYALRGRVYAEVKATGIGSQAAQHVVKKVRDAYTVVYAQIKTGLLRGARAAKAVSKPVVFKPGAAQAFDDRCLSWDLEARTVSIRTVTGRLRGIRFACSKRDRACCGRTAGVSRTWSNAMASSTSPRRLRCPRSYRTTIRWISSGWTAES